jgi:hypothetical protein
MRDDSVLVAVEDALRRPAYCGCGSPQRIETHDNAIWLECTAFERPSRLPKGLALFVRDFAHDRKLVIELEDADSAALAA